MAAHSWLLDRLLGSPVPPPRWLDPRHRHTGWVAPRQYFYFGWSTPSYYVPPDRVQAELDELGSCVNPPVVQGWAWLMALVGVAVALLGLRGIRVSGGGDGLSMLLVLAPLPAWLLLVWIGAFFSHDVELRAGTVYVRRWTDVWLGRRGTLIGPRSTVHAAQSCSNHLQMAGDSATVTVSTTMWPTSSLQSLEDHFEGWGIQLESPGHHHSHHPQHWNHGHHRFSRPIPEQSRHRRP